MSESAEPRSNLEFLWELCALKVSHLMPCALVSFPVKWK